MYSPTGSIFAGIVGVWQGKPCVMPRKVRMVVAPSIFSSFNVTLSIELEVAVLCSAFL